MGGPLPSRLLAAVLVLAAVAVHAAAQCNNPPPGYPTNSRGFRCSFPVAVGANCTAPCNTGYTSQPPPTRTCTGVNTWSVETGSCRQVCLGMPPDDLVAFMANWDPACNSATRFNTWCSGQCRPGFSGNPRIYCGSKSATNPSGWSMSIQGKCVRGSIVCASLPNVAVQNGVFPASCLDSAPNEICQATCLYGYTSWPPPSLTCRSDGTWSPPASPLKCEKVCLDLPSAERLDFGTWPESCRNNVTVQGVCRGVCNPGYMGNPTVRCGNGAWTGSVTGKCVRATATANGVLCSGVPTAAIVNGRWPTDACKDSIVGANCSGVCNYAYNSRPAPVVTCQAEGSWSGVLEGACNPVPTTCPLQPTAPLADGVFPAACAGRAIGATCSATCNAGTSGAATVTCQASSQWDSTATGTCANIDACSITQCHTSASCTDLPPPAGPGASGRNCSCGPGLYYAGDATGCQDINACNPQNACHPSATGCVDIPAPAPNSPQGRVCQCAAGQQYKSDAEGCVEVDACSFFNCTGDGRCVDIVGGANSTAGRTCRCDPGKVYTEAQGCQNLDACQSTPCAGAANCTDLPPPYGDGAAGRMCNCTPGLAYVEGTGCVDIDGCGGAQGNPCASIQGSNGTCFDVSAPANDFTCACSAGFEWAQADHSCIDIDSCSPNQCIEAAWPNTNGNCTDLKPPSTGYACGCKPGWTWLDGAGCVDTNDCLSVTCSAGSNGTCVDAVAPSTGYQCACLDGYQWNSTELKCKDIDACIINQCIGQGTAASCTDLPAPALNNAAGRNCSCVDKGQAYVNDTAGCLDIDACVLNPCGAGAECVDQVGGSAGPDGRNCSCATTGTMWANSSAGCIDFDGCAGNPCGLLNNTVAGACTDLPAPSLGFECTCAAGFWWNSTGPACQDVDACVEFSCVGDASCVDIAGGANSTAGRVCSCGAGKEYNVSVGCQDINACATSPCFGPHTVCQDLKAPAGNGTDGRNCSCESGWTYANDTAGCVDIDACQTARCGPGAICTDIPLGPADDTGRTCSCDSLPGTFYANNTAGCVDVDSCAVSPCDGKANAVNGSCTDILAPLSGFSCACQPGYAWANTTAECVDIDSCSPNQCTEAAWPNTNGNCTDLKPTSTGYACGCKPGWTWLDGAGCVDTNDCLSVTCSAGSNGTCVDAVAPSTGYQCACLDGYQWNSTELKCKDIDACIINQCIGQGTAASCTDLPAPALNNAAGRNCSCLDPSTFYANDTVGCVDIDACVLNSCGANATCTDKPGGSAGQDGRNCSCTTTGTIWANATVGCIDVDSCAQQPCAQIPNAVSTSCVDRFAPDMGFTCACNSGWAWNLTANACDDVDGCVRIGGGNPCANITGSDGTCSDVAAGSLVAGQVGFKCGCEPGRVFNFTSGLCDDVDACINYACYGGAACIDKPAPLNLDNKEGRTCSCPAGTNYTEGVGCQNIIACLSALCHVSATCIDLPPPASDGAAGRVCNCSDGLEYLNDSEGCKNIDGCASQPCNSIANAVAGSCTDKPPPLTGFSCQCSANYEWKNGQCTDINSCASPDPCVSLAGTVVGGGCQDIPATVGNGYSCTCVSGRVWNTTTLQCDEIDGCRQSGVNCGPNSQCVDVPSPTANPTAYTCNCGAGTQLVTGVCQDIDGCTNDPCNPSKITGSNGTCFDAKAPATGFSCGCASTHVWNGQACIATACRFGPTVAVSDGSWPDCSRTPVGAVCTAVCKPGFYTTGDLRVPRSTCRLRADDPGVTEWTGASPVGCVRDTMGGRRLSEWRRQWKLGA